MNKKDSFFPLIIGEIEVKGEMGKGKGKNQPSASSREHLVNPEN
jgi:hypothetical protein